MKSMLTLIISTLLLSACASGHGGSQNQMYGEIKAGYETSHRH